MNTMVESLPELVNGYLRVRRALGYKLESTEAVLRRFVAYLDLQDAQRVTVTDAVAFATAPPTRTPRTQALRLSAIRCFTRWARCQSADIEVPPARILPARPTRVAPFIYTEPEIRALLDATTALRPEQRAATYRSFIGLMAATGIRTGESLALDKRSFDRRKRTLTVTGKYGKIRQLPLHATVADALSDYLDRHRGFSKTDDPALFISTRGTRLHPSSVHPTFRQLTAAARLGAASSACRPRLHDLRHTFAVSTMVEAYRRGDDPAVVLPILSTWLGHTEPRDTYWYLTGTAELLEAAAATLQRHTDEPDQS